MIEMIGWGWMGWMGWMGCGRFTSLETARSLAHVWEAVRWLLETAEVTVRRSGVSVGGRKVR